MFLRMAYVDFPKKSWKNAWGTFRSFSAQNSLFFRAVQLKLRFLAKMGAILTNAQLYRKITFYRFFAIFDHVLAILAIF